MGGWDKRRFGLSSSFTVAYSSKPVWMNKNVLRIIRRKKRLWTWYTTEGGRDLAIFMAYKKVKSEVQNAVKMPIG